MKFKSSSQRKAVMTKLSLGNTAKWKTTYLKTPSSKEIRGAKLSRVKEKPFGTNLRAEITTMKSPSGWIIIGKAYEEKNKMFINSPAPDYHIIKKNKIEAEKSVFKIKRRYNQLF